MEERRARRLTGRGQQQPRPLLHLRTPNRTHNNSLNSTLSCCYCDYKISALNDPLFRFGRKHANWLRSWFSIGVGFALTSLLGATMILLWELGVALRVFRRNAWFSGSLLFGLSPDVYGLRLSPADAWYLVFSTVVSVSVHELGHAIAAASEGVQMEYIAIFVAVLFPGSLVAFSWEMLQALENFTVLRVYCAGVWHNAVCCGACGLALFLMPFLLCPFYAYGGNPMVSDVLSTSPLSGFLSPGDVIVSLDGNYIHNAQEWIEKAALLDKQTHQKLKHSAYSEGLAVVHGRSSYCLPISTVEESQKIYLAQNPPACPNYLTEFVAIPCDATRKLHDGSIDDDAPTRRENRHCLNSNEVVKLSKCFNEMLTEITNGSSCSCSQDEYCSSPVQLPGSIWTEISYSRPYSPECLQLGRRSDSDATNFTGQDCGGTFVFVGDVVSMAHSIQLTVYHPRRAFAFSVHVPKVIERSLLCTFHVSLTLALLNSLPVYFLDGESIVEVALCHFTSLGPRKRARVLQVFLLGGTLFSILTFVRVFSINFL